MEREIPNISDSGIKRIIKRDFPWLEFIEIENILKTYKSESKKGWNRVCASILKLSNGNIESLRKYVVIVNYDFRDIIALSEYPNYPEYAFDDKLSKKKERQLIKDDWMQYKVWLEKV